MDILLYGMIALCAGGIGYAFASTRHGKTIHTLQTFMQSLVETMRHSTTTDTPPSSYARNVSLSIAPVSHDVPAALRSTLETTTQMAHTIVETIQKSAQAHQTALKTIADLEYEIGQWEQECQDLVQQIEQATITAQTKEKNLHTDQELLRRLAEQEQRKQFDEIRSLRTQLTATEQINTELKETLEQKETTLLQIQEELHTQQKHIRALQVEHETEKARTEQTVAQMNNVLAEAEQDKKKHTGEITKVRREIGYNEGKVRQLMLDATQSKQQRTQLEDQLQQSQTRYATLQEDVRFLRTEVLRLQDLHQEVLVDNDELSTQIMVHSDTTINDLRQKEKDSNEMARVLNSAIEQLAHKHTEQQSTIDTLRIQLGEALQKSNTLQTSANEADELRAERDHLRIAKEQVDGLFKQLLNKLAQYENNGVPSATIMSDSHLVVQPPLDSLNDVSKLLDRHQPVVLVVEDSSTNRHILEIMLKKIHFTMISARTGEEALLLASQYSPDLILQDLVLPDTDGFALCEQYKSNPATAAIPVIFISSLSDTDAKVRGFELGAVDYITKPFDEAEVLERVKLHYRMRRMEAELRIMMKDLESARLQTEGSYQAKSSFLANMSHELRTPLNAILGFIQILQKDPNITEQQQRYVDTIYSSGFFLLQLINDLLDLSKLEAGKMTFEVEPIDIRSFVGSIREMFVLRCAEKELSIDYTVSDDVPKIVVADMKRLRQVFVNLVGNAVKFTSTGGIHIGANIANHEGQTMMELMVSDTGRGIPADQITSIMEPFTQVRGMKSEGTGLGLALVQRIVDVMGGTMRIESKLGFGSKFFVALPLIVPESNITATVTIETPKRFLNIKGDIRPMVLVVDDSRTNRLLLRDMLTPLGFVCIEAVDGIDSLEKFDEVHPPIVLMDIAMPKMTGDIAMQHIRERDRTRDVSTPTVIIAITASVIRSEIDSLVKAGFDAVLMKPFLIDDLFAILSTIARLEFDTEAILPTTKSSEVKKSSPENIAVLLRQVSSRITSDIEAAVHTQDFTALLALLQQLHDIMATEDDILQKPLMQTLYTQLYQETLQENYVFFSKLSDALLR